jgi:hypothetical protein
MHSRTAVVLDLLFLAIGGGCAAESTGGMEIAFICLADGDTVAATLDSSGQPVPILIQIRATGPACLGIGLTADQISVASSDNPAGEVPFEIVVPWVPAWGAGAHVLEIGATTADKSGHATARIAVTITGIPALPRPLPPLSRSEAQTRIIALCRERFEISLSAQALARKERYGVFSSPWVSTA